jgi:hypothetical protein
MINIEFLDITGDQTPIDKFYEFNGIVYTFRLKYNDVGKFFTIEIFDSLNTTLLFSNKVNYGSNLVDSILGPFDNKIIPLNINILSGETGTEEITEETLGNDIKLYTNIEEELVTNEPL